MKVTAVLVSHNGARWLPQVLAALRDAEDRPDAVVAVDTGSEDASVALVEGALGVPVVHRPADTGYPDAVRAGLAAAAPAEPEEWVWLIHDDSAPAPDCLAVLRAAAAVVGEEIVVLGPKLREWPSLRRLLEVGVTISGTGRRETGLEPGEYDQGQHDTARRVLAVNTAGMLIRRSTLERVGLDAALPLFGNDVDLGWRLARQDRQVWVEPAAVMFHAEAAHRGQRRAALGADHRRAERSAALFVLLANGRGRTWALRWVRLLVGSLLRALGLLLVRAPGEARDEIAALLTVYAAPWRVLGARRARAAAATAPPGRVGELLPPPWMPWRHGLDFVAEVARAAVHVARERLRDGAGDDRRPWYVRAVTSPAPWVGLLSTVVALVAGRDLLHGAPLRGGALLAAPDGPGHWWALWADSWHWVGAGSDAAAPAYLLPLAVAGTVLAGQPALVVWLLFCLGVPLAYLGALRGLRRLSGGRWVAVWGAAAYALLPVLSGAVAQGRLGTVAGAVLLPWAASALTGLADPDRDRRTRSLWRAGALAALVVAFVPYAAVLLAALVPLLGRLGARERTGRSWLLLVPSIVALLPWLPTLVRTPGAVLVEAGRAAALDVRPGLGEVLTAIPGGPGSAPSWMLIGLPVAALAALLRADTRALVIRCWTVALLGALAAVVLSRVPVSLPGITEEFRPWPGFALLVVGGAWVAAATVAGSGLLGVVSGRSFGVRQPVAAVAVVLALAAPLLGSGWWLVEGTPGPLHRSARPQVPGYMSALAESRHDSGVVVVAGGPGSRAGRTVGYRVVRSALARIGDDGVLAATPPDPDVDGALERLVAGDTGGVAEVLAAHGIAYVYAPGPVSPAVSGALDATGGFATASAPAARARAWRLVPVPSTAAVAADGSAIHPWLVTLQVLGLVAVVVLCLPGRRQR